MPKANPFRKGEKFGRLTALGEHKTLEGGKKSLEKCLCECGKILWVDRRTVRVGDRKSCGCLRSELGRLKLIKADTTHGMSRTRIYRIYRLMIDRCTNEKNKHFNHYGGRGIKCLWNSFEEFYKDMGIMYNKHCEEYGEEETTIERVDVNGNYCKENCTRATRKEQAKNKRSSLSNRQQCKVTVRVETSTFKDLGKNM